MSRRNHSPSRGRQAGQAALFAALGDETRLAIVGRLVGGSDQSIAELTDGSRLTRQAVRKHLRVLERAKIVRGARAGRENRFALDRKSIDAAQLYLDRMARQWDDALSRLKILVEE